MGVIVLQETIHRYNKMQKDMTFFTEIGINMPLVFHMQPEKTLDS